VTHSRPPVLSRRALVAALAVAGLATGCAEGFDPFNRLSALRVLAIQSDPVAPAPDETTALVPLVYVPPGDAIASLRWSWCPFAGPANDGYPCLITEKELAELGGGSAEDIPPFDLGEGPTANLTHTLDPALLDTVCRGAADQPELLDCEGGFPVQIKLTARSEDGDEVDTVRILRLRFSDEQEPNQNPTVDGLRAVLEAGEQAIGEEPTVALVRREETVIRADVPAEVIESYTGVDEDGEPEERTEQLLLTWFVESGDTKNQRTTFIDDVESLADATENEWEPDGPDDYPRDTSQIVVVVRDDRDGVAWTSGRVALEEAP
jgi:hypothetical protein